MTAHETVDRCVGSTEIYFSSHPDDIARAKELCGGCPLARRSRCARDAIERGDKFGIWAGVHLPGIQPRDRDKLAEAIERLRRIGGLDRCDTCWGWFPLGTGGVDAATVEEALSAEHLPRHRLERQCPTCASQSADASQLGALVDAEESAAAHVVDLPPSGDRGVRQYWELRHQGRRAAEGDWLLVDPQGRIEGSYAWSIAVHTFGRTPQRFRAMVTSGWTVRRATTRDSLRRSSNELAADAPVSA